MTLNLILIAFQGNNQHPSAFVMTEHEHFTDRLQTSNEFATIKIDKNKKVPLPSSFKQKLVPMVQPNGIEVKVQCRVAKLPILFL